MTEPAESLESAPTFTNAMYRLWQDRDSHVEIRSPVRVAGRPVRIRSLPPQRGARGGRRAQGGQPYILADGACGCDQSGRRILLPGGLERAATGKSGCPSQSSIRRSTPARLSLMRPPIVRKLDAWLRGAWAKS